MKEELYDDIFEEKEERTDYRAILFRYIIRWPWFVASIFVCLLSAWIYLRYTTPVYNISASIIIKDLQKGGSSGSDLAAFEGLGILNVSKNIDNEIEILRSKSLIKDVVSELGLYTNYFAKGNINDVELYNSSPVSVLFSPEDAERLTTPLTLTLNYQTDGQVEVWVANDEKSITKRFTGLPAVIPTEWGTITLQSGSHKPANESGSIEILIRKPLTVAKQYLEVLSIEPTSKTTSIATLSIEDTNRQRGEDFINKLVEIYNRNANNDKNEIAENTARFINERISIINQELGTTEQELETFKREAGLTDIASDARLAVSEKSEYEKRCVENGTQLNLVEYLYDYLREPKNANNVLPANVGLDDTSLAALINQYNSLILERERLLRTSSETNPVIQHLINDIGGMRANIATTIASVRKGLLITKADLDRQAGKFAGQISNVPNQERHFISIQRQQEIKAGLYLMLLQKREENNITLAATTNNAKIIDDALADDAPVSPKRTLIFLIAFVLGVFIPVTVIYIQNLLSFRIEGQADIEKLTTVPIIGNIPMSGGGDGKMQSIAVHENDNGIMEETFRSLRTNLLFMMDGPEKKVILITSTTSGEGKTFIATNLAISLSLLGKKVIIVGLDIRKPGLNKAFNIPAKGQGITQYLASPQSTDLRSLIMPSGVTGNLSLLMGGTIPPNPTELLTRQSLDEAIGFLRQEYDYVILDSAPIGMVTDTQIIARVADISIYICRADYTYKDDYRFINELQENNRLPCLCTAINGVDMASKKYGYGYGYGKKYGYGYGYGYDKSPDRE